MSFDQWNNQADVGNPYQWDMQKSNTQQTTKSVPKKKGGRGGTATSLISEGGALGGALAGAAAGSVVPIIGTAIGGIIGGGIGAFGGRLAENKVRDDRWGVGDAAKEGAITTVLGAPGKAIKGAVKAGQALKGGAGLEDALIAGASKASGPSMIKAAIAGKAADSADALATKALGLTKGQKNKFFEKTGEKAGTVARKYNITSADDIPKVLDPLQQQFDSVITQIPKQFTMHDVQTAFANVYTPLLQQIGPTGKESIGLRLKQEADNIISKMGDKGGKLTARELNDARKSFDDLAYNLRATDPSAADVNKMGRDVLADLMRGAADEAGLKTAGGKSLKEAGTEISKLRRLHDAAKKNAEGAGGSNVISLNNTPGAVMGSSMGPAGAAVGYVANAAANSSRGRQVIAKGADTFVDKTAASVEKSGSFMGNVKSLGRNITGVNLADALIQSSQNPQDSGNTNVQNTPTMTTSTNNPSNPNMSQSYQNSQQMSSMDNFGGQQQQTSPYSKENLMYDVQRDPQNAAKYISHYKDLAEIFAPTDTGESDLTAGQQGQAARATNAMNDLDVVKNAINDGSLLKTALPGSNNAFIGNALGTTDINSALFNIGDVVLRNRTGAAAPADEVRKFVAGFLPRGGESKEAQQYKLQRAYQELLGMVNPPKYLGQNNPRPATMEDTLMAQYQ